MAVPTVKPSILAVIGDYGDAFEGISGGNEPLKKAIGAAIQINGLKIAQIA